MIGLLFMLCVSYSGGNEDCSFTWEITDIEHPNYAGWFDSESRTIIGEDIPTIIHETRHVMCHLQYAQPAHCHAQVDLEGMSEKLEGHQRYTPAVPEHNPIIQLEIDGIVL